MHLLMVILTSWVSEGVRARAGMHKEVLAGMILILAESPAEVEVVVVRACRPISAAGFEGDA